MSTASQATSTQLPLAGLLALAMTGFVAILTETLPAGLLPQIGSSLHASPAMTGQLVTLYAAGSLAAAIPLTAAMQGMRRRPRLLIAVVAFLVFNTVTGLSSSFALTLLARFMAGVAAGLAWGIIPGYARLMASGEQQGRGMAVAMVGTPLALALGVPAGSFLGHIVSWRTCFLIMSLLTIGLIVWVLWKVPDFPGQQAAERQSVRKVLLTPGIRPVLAVIFFWMVAHNILYTYVAPFVNLAGLEAHVDLVLLIFGVAALVGIWIVGLLVDRWLRPLTLGSLCGFILSALALGLAGANPFIVYGAVAVWGLTFGGAATLLQTALADAAGDGVDIAQALNTTVWNLAIAGGGMVGGVLLGSLGARSFPWALFCLLLVALATTWKAKKYSFPSERSAPNPQLFIEHVQTSNT